MSDSVPSLVNDGRELLKRLKHVKQQGESLENVNEGWQRWFKRLSDLKGCSDDLKDLIERLATRNDSDRTVPNRSELRELLELDPEAGGPYDVAVANDGVELAKQGLTPKEQRVFETLCSYRFGGTFENLRDAGHWDDEVFDSSIETSLKRLRTKLPPEWWFSIHNDFSFKWQRRPYRKKP